MMENNLFFKKMTDNQRRVFIDTVQLYEAFLDAHKKSLSYAGGMHWKKSKGREYLFRSRDRYGYGKSLGVRSAETEKILDEFRKAKKSFKERMSILKERLKEQARFCKAAMIQRVPRIVTNILRVLVQQNLLGKNIVVVGTNALYAYEAAAGIFFDRPIMETKDMDILWDIRPKLTLLADDKTEPGGLLTLLRKTDRSFELSSSQRFRAVNRHGYIVDLIKAEPKRVMTIEPLRMGGPGDLEAIEIRNLHWLLNSPKFSQVVIGDDGYPSEMAVPDPRAFALHKFWLTGQTDREPVKKQRDRDQAMGVVRLVIQHLPQYAFKRSDLKIFPKQVVIEAQQQLPEIEGFPGFEIEHH
jgi:hypothetical protein